jgi:hypothetical protein
MTVLARHRWGESQFVPRNPDLARNDQTERVCINCGLVRITVHPPQGFPWREWRDRGSSIQYTADRTPECVPAATSLEAATWP